MTDTQALRNLLEKVTRKHPKHNPAMWFMDEVRALGWSISLVARAYNGSLDAAKALHEALLPGWDWSTSVDAHSERWVVVGDGVHFETDECYHEIPARAWLIAILKARLSEQEGE